MSFFYEIFCKLKHKKNIVFIMHVEKTQLGLFGFCVKLYIFLHRPASLFSEDVLYAVPDKILWFIIQDNDSNAHP